MLATDHAQRHSTPDALPTTRPNTPQSVAGPTEQTHLLFDSDMLLPPVNDPAAVYRGTLALGASILGTGVLAMPSACKSVGVLPFIALSIFAALVCHTTALYLARTVKFLHADTSEATYASLGKFVLGHSWEKAIQWALVMQQLGACVGYVVVIGDVFTPVLQLMLGDRFGALPASVVRNLIVWLVIFPITVSVRDIGSLKHANAGAVFAICAFCLTVLVNAFLLFAAPEPLPAMDLTPSRSIGFLHTVPLICFAYDMHFNSVPVYNDVKQGLPSKAILVVFKWSSRVAFLLSLVFTVIIGIAGYASFGPDTQPDILQNFPVAGTAISPVMNIVRSLYGFGLVLAFPVIVWELRAVLLILTFSREYAQSTAAFWSVTLFAVLVTSLVVMLVSDVTVVFGLVGCTITPMLDYVVPCALYLKSGTAADYRDEVRPLLIMALGVLLIPLGFGFWVAANVF